MSAGIYLARSLSAASHREVVFRLDGTPAEPVLATVTSWLATVGITNAVVAHTRIVKYGAGFTLHTEIYLEDAKGVTVEGRYKHHTEGDTLALAARALNIPVDSTDIARLLNMLDAIPEAAEAHPIDPREEAEDG